MNKRQRGITWAMAMLVVGAGVWSAVLQADNRDADRRDAGKRRVTAQPANVKLPYPVLDTHGLMELFNKQWYELLKKEMQQEPAGEENWNTIHDRGLQSAELTNLIAIREMADEHRAAWMKHTGMMRQAGLRLAEVAETRDWEATQAAYGNLIKNCNACHQEIAPEQAPMLKP